MVLPAIFLMALFFLVKEGVPVILALRSGVVRTRGHRPVPVQRAVEPERFRKLVAGRTRLAGTGLLSAFWLAVTILWDHFQTVGGWTPTQ